MISKASIRVSATLSSGAGKGGSACRVAAAALSLCLVAAAAGSGGQGRYLGTRDFLELAFGGEPPEAQTLWITKKYREPLESLLGHPFGSLRLRYWRNGGRTVWIIDEIGKERPITIGVVVEEDAIRDLRILEFRESRGWEVRYPFFTDQFRGAKLETNGKLDTGIDGITGATLSVGAVRRVARAALYLHEQVVDGR
ncbi:MAG TPA: FMN-binding protein [Woeseiaceae bacterium]|jgi:hypothetical protein|nr:FMN-binding protein [Woeseiaceae bacterium]